MQSSDKFQLCKKMTCIQSGLSESSLPLSMREGLCIIKSKKQLQESDNLDIDCQYYDDKQYKIEKCKEEKIFRLIKIWISLYLNQLSIGRMEFNNFRKQAILSTPGKVILCGEHAVVYGEDALAMAINLRCKATLYSKICSQQQQPQIIFKGSINCIINLKTFHEKKHQQYSQCIKQNHQDQQAFKIYYKLGLFLQQTHLSFKNNLIYLLLIQSQIPIGKCLGSSASFNTLLVASFFLILSPLTSDLKGQFLDQPKKLIDLHQVNRISKIFERVQHGTPSGIDNYIATFGGLVLYNNSKNPPFKKISDNNIVEKLTQKIQFRLIDSGIEKNTKKAVGVVRQNYQKEEKYREMIKIIGSFSQRILNLLEKNDENDEWISEFLGILKQNHNFLNLLGVSLPQIESIVKQNTETGKRSGKITGAGMGGYILIAQIPQKKNEKEKKKEIISKIDEKGLMIQYL